MIDEKRLPAARVGTAFAVAAMLIVVTLVFPMALRAEEILVTNVFDSEDIISVLRDISAQTGVNILAEPSVQG